jgi:hypothetical protein
VWAPIVSAHGPPQARASASASAAGRRNDSNSTQVHYRPTAYSPGHYYSSQLHPDFRLMLIPSSHLRLSVITIARGLDGIGKK